MMKKILRIALVVTMLAAMLLCATSCAKVKLYVQVDSINSGYEIVNIDSNGNAVGLPAGNNAVTDTTAAPVADTTAAPVADTTTPAAEDTTAAPVADTTAAAAPAGTPSTNEEIVALYVSAYNKIAAEATKATKTYDYTSNYNNILKIGNNSTLSGIAESLMGKFMVENTDAVDFAVADVPPVGLTTSPLTAADVASATCVDNGATYTVTITSTGTDANPEVNPTVGGGSAGKIGPLIETSSITDAVGGIIKFEGLALKYSDCSATATIDKATGRITELYLRMPGILHFDKVTAAVVVSVNDCDIGLLGEQRWTITY
ncbi:MAG: hypothetical protein IJA31_13080 [Clostridia bacterium]|nr:hypothetical protein [Clostridia bacterium]MBR2413079.1 hypothetical protein [Clostridia bacterium]